MDMMTPTFELNLTKVKRANRRAIYICVRLNLPDLHSGRWLADSAPPPPPHLPPPLPRSVKPINNFSPALRSAAQH